MKSVLFDLQVGDRSDSNVYIKQKLKASTEIGVDAQYVKLPQSSTQAEVCSENSVTCVHNEENCILGREWVGWKGS